MPTSRNICTARSMAVRRSTFWWARSASATCAPTRYTGLSAVIGSWNTKPMSRPRMSRIALSDSFDSSRPLKVILPPAT